MGKRLIVLSGIVMVSLIVVASLVITGFYIPFSPGPEEGSVGSEYEIVSILDYNFAILYPIPIGDRVYFELYVQNMSDPHWWPVETYLASMDLVSGNVTKHVRLWRGDYAEFMETGIGHLYGYDGKYIYFIRVNKSGDEVTRVYGVFDPVSSRVIVENLTELVLKVMEGENGEFRPPTTDELGYRYWWIPVNGYLVVVGIMHYSLGYGDFERRIGLVNVASGDLVWIYDVANTGSNSSLIIVRQLYPTERNFTIETGEFGYEWYAHSHPSQGVYLIGEGELGFINIGVSKEKNDGDLEYLVNFHYTLINSTGIKVFHSKAPAPIYMEHESGGWYPVIEYTGSAIYAFVFSRFYTDSEYFRETRFYRLDWDGNLLWYLNVSGQYEEPVLSFGDDWGTMTPVRVFRKGSKAYLAYINDLFTENYTGLEESLRVIEIDDTNGYVVGEYKYTLNVSRNADLKKIRFYDSLLVALLVEEEKFGENVPAMKIDKLVVLFYNGTIKEVNIRDLISSFSKELWGKEVEGFSVTPINIFSQDTGVYLVVRTSLYYQGYTVVVKVF